MVSRDSEEEFSSTRTPDGWESPRSTMVQVRIMDKKSRFLSIIDSQTGNVSHNAGQVDHPSIPKVPGFFSLALA
jgi:hypothetical protein